MAVKLYNTLTKQLEVFKPIEPGRVKMYHCGPTVYDYVHIGNMRSFLLADILRRTFEFLGFEVRQIMNITDVGIGGNNDEGEDKIIKGLKREGKAINMESMKELANFYTERFKEDIAKLNIKIPDVLPKASEHISEQIKLIEILENRGLTYQTSDTIYFNTAKDPHYGKLGGLSDSVESRLGPNSEKRNARDFALWKLNSNLGFPSPWGQGFPGWHLECSAMSIKYLGHTFDIHTGGRDLAPIHHNNEIAQSENACDCEFVHYWLHNEFVNIADSKMAKSEGNQITLKSLIERNYSPLAYRYFLLMAHYRTPVSFSWEALEAAQRAYRNLKEYIATLKITEAEPPQHEARLSSKEEFEKALENDLNTPEALSVVWKLVKDELVSPALKRATFLEFDRVLGLDLENNEYEVRDIPKEVGELLKERESARASGDYSRSDQLRRQIKKFGFIVEDSASGQKLSKSSYVSISPW